MRKETKEEWESKGESLFGKNKLEWKFQCPQCNNVVSAEDFRKFKDQGASPDSAYQECIGRYTGGRKGPNKCDWASYGLFRGPNLVIREDGKETPVFEFAGEK